MTIIEAIILGLLQGATEFLPVSSSGHLVLVPWLLGWQASSLTFDTTVHLGTLAAVVVYFRHDIWHLILGGLKLIRDRSLEDSYSRLAFLIIVGSIPTAIIGLLLEDFFTQLFGTPLLVSIFLLITGLILFVSERMSQQNRDLTAMGWKDAVLIGIAQGAAITPGISRSGSTIAAALALSVNRYQAARFSFLLSLPVILGAGLFKLKDAVEIGLSSAEISTLGVGFGVAALSGYACIHFLLEYLRQRSLYIFSVYCWVFGLFCLIVALVSG